LKINKVKPKSAIFRFQFRAKRKRLPPEENTILYLRCIMYIVKNELRKARRLEELMVELSLNSEPTVAQVSVQCSNLS